MQTAHTAQARAAIEKIFNDQTREISIRLDRFFAFLLLIQWFAAALVTFFYSENTWLGEHLTPWEGLLITLIMGAALVLPAFYGSWRASGLFGTRLLIAVSQVTFSIVFNWLTGGRAEMHFHIFVSLAALAFYKDVPVLIAASLVVVSDHILRSLLFPVSVYGAVEVNNQWKWLELTAWIVVENIILILGIHRIRKELWEMAASKYLLMVAREEALKLSSKKTDFLSSMSHEIRTPLNSVVGFADLLKDTNLDSEQKEYVSTIHRCSEALLHIINDILDISRIESGLMEIDRHRFDFKELHEDIHRMFHAKCEEKGLKLKLSIESNAPQFVEGDSHRLRQILINLVGNAVKFTDQGNVQVEVRRQPFQNTYHWTIRDTGKGIDPQNVPKLFHSFYQADPSVSRKYGGSGLGLMISKNLVELMGGGIQVESRQGVGTTFSFSLPLKNYTDASD